MLYITFVVYNKHINEIKCREKIKNLVIKHGRDKIKTIVIDNSDNLDCQVDDEIRSYIAESGIIYINNEENLGLSKAYNRSIDYALHDSSDHNDDFMLFVDDDTDISEEYLESMLMESLDPARKSDGVNVICGIVDSDDKPMSPVKQFKFIYKSNDFITEPGIYEDIVSINSGTVVRLSALEKIDGYDERLFLDMTDYLLFYNLKRHGLCKVLVTSDRMSQSFSGRTKTDKKTAFHRFDIFKKDFQTYSEITGKSRFYTWLYLTKRRVMIEIKSS